MDYRFESRSGVVVVSPRGGGSSHQPDGPYGRSDPQPFVSQPAGDGLGDGLDGTTGQTDLCGTGLCNPGGASLAMLLGLMLMRFGYRRPIRRA